jgi:hypothetical protein
MMGDHTTHRVPLALHICVCVCTCARAHARQSLMADMDKVPKNVRLLPRIDAVDRPVSLDPTITVRHVTERLICKVI